MVGGHGDIQDLPSSSFPAALCLARTKGWELDPSAAGMKPKKHIVSAEAAKPACSGVSWHHRMFCHMIKQRPMVTNEEQVEV